MLRWVIRAAVSVTVVVLLITVVPLPAILSALSRVRLWAWIVSVLGFFAGHYCNAWKLQLLIGRHAVPLSSCVRAQYAGLVANLGLPGLAGGDLVRATYLMPVAGTRRVALASAADRLIDTASVLTLVVIALPLAGVPPALATVVSGVMVWVIAGIAALVVIAAGVLLMRRGGRLPKVLTQGLDALRSRRAAVLTAFAISLGVQAAFVLTNMWLARQVGVETGAAAWFVAWPLAKLVAVLPVSLGGIGVREAALVSLLSPYGAPREAVLASGFLWQAVLTLTGLSGLLITQMLPRPAVAVDAMSDGAAR